MSKDHISVKFTCKKCRGTVLEIPDNYTDNSIATCKGCGAKVGRWGDIKAESLKLAKSKVESALKDIFKR